MLSRPATLWPAESRRSTILLPIKPAAPVARTRKKNLRMETENENRNWISLTLAREESIDYPKKSAAARCAFPLTQTGCPAKHNAASSSWRTRPENRVNHAADIARARAVSADPAPPSSL